MKSKIEKKIEKKLVRKVVVKKVEKEQEKEKDYKLAVTLEEMLAAGCHLGHKISKTHPKAKKNIFAAKDGIQITDLLKTQAALEKACRFIHNARGVGKQVVMVGTKRQAREVVKRVAIEAGVPYVTDRWLGGTITNWSQIQKSLKRMEFLKDGLTNGKFKESTKKEILEMEKEKIRLERMLGGLMGLERLFDILFVVDVGYEKTAIKEARLKGIKIVAMVDTDSDPGRADYPIPANDDSVKSVNLIVEEIGRALK